MNKPVAWSYSSLNAFETCPHRYHQTKIAKAIVEPQTEATEWGNRVHKAFEYRVGHNTPFPEELKEYEPIAQKLLKAADGKRVGVEQKLALSRDLVQRKWFDKDVWVRGIIDVTIEHGSKLFIGDYKTGKPNPDSAQLRLTAAMTFAARPWINEITNTFIWLKTGAVTTEKFERNDGPAIWQEFLPRVKRLEEAVALDKFPKRPSGLCRAYCPVHTCEHNGNYRGGK